MVTKGFFLRGRTCKSVPETMISTTWCTHHAPLFREASASKLRLHPGPGAHSSGACISARLKHCPGKYPHTYFSQRLQLGLHDELVLAELTAACVRALDPLLQAGLVHEVQAPCAVAGGDQRALIIPFTVTDPRAAEKPVIMKKATQQGR